MQSTFRNVIGPNEPEAEDLSGRVAIVTGGALGIGFEIASAFVQNGARVIMINRKEEQGQNAIQEIKKRAGEDAKIEWLPCDLGNLEDVQKTFSDLREKESRLDLLILNAGVNANKYAEDADGIDRHFGVNWLGQFYALNQLYPLLRETSKMSDTPAPRIIFQSSELHKVAPNAVRFASLDEINDSNVGSAQLYGRSKLAQILGARFGMLDRVIKPNGDKIFAVSVHPGTVNTDAQKQWDDAYPGLTGKLIKSVGVLVSRDVDQGAFTAVYAAISPDVAQNDWNGCYLDDPGHLGSVSKQAEDPALGAALWDLSHQIVQDQLGKDAMIPWNA